MSKTRAKALQRFSQSGDQLASAFKRYRDASTVSGLEMLDLAAALNISEGARTAMQRSDLVGFDPTTPEEVSHVLWLQMDAAYCYRQAMRYRDKGGGVADWLAAQCQEAGAWSARNARYQMGLEP